MHSLPTLALASIALITGSARAGVHFEVIDLPGESTSATEISGDGTTVVGGIFSSQEVFRWRRDTGVVNLNGGTGTGGAPSCSHDGSRVTGTITDPMTGFESAGLWVEGSGWTALGGLPLGTPLDGTISSGWGISGDGLTCVGLGWGTPGPGSAEAFEWTAGTGMVNRGSGFGDSRISRTNFDGSVHAGWTGHPTAGVWRATVWVNGVMDIIEPDAYVRGFSSVYNVNEDGSIVVGEHIDAGTETQPGACFWTRTGDDWVRNDIGTLFGDENPFNDYAGAQDVSADGSVIVGISRNGFVSGVGDGWMWTEDEGMVNITTFLADNGAPIPDGFNVLALTGVSSDGLVMTGWGTQGPFPHVTQSFIITICPADLNNDAEVNSGDLAILLAAWGSADPNADLDGDGIVSSTDLAVLLAAWGSCLR